MKNLVIGSKGFLGKTLCNYLRGKGQTVIELDIKNGNHEDVRKITLPLEGIDRVYFLAWDVGGSKYLFVKDNQLNQLLWNHEIITNVFKQLNTIPFVFVSSQLSEKHETVYGVQKKYGEVWTKLTENGVVVRLWNLYGYMEEDGVRSHVISDFVDNAMRNGEIRIITDGEELRQFIHIDDVCRGLELAFSVKDRKETYDISSFEWIKIIDVANLIQKYVNCNIIRGTESGETVWVDNRDKLPGWDTEISLEKGIKRMVENNRK